MAVDRPEVHDLHPASFVYVHYYICENFTMSEDAIQKKFRLPRQQIQQLLDLVGPTLSRQTQRSYPLSPEIDLLAALLFLSFFTVIVVDFIKNTTFSHNAVN